MQSDILQKFLDQGLLHLGEDTDKFNYVKSAAADLANDLKENRRKLIRGSSILVGGTLDEREPLLEDCANAIKVHWPTYRGRFASNTTQLFRATLLQALAQVAEDESSVTYAAIIFYTTRGLLPFFTPEKEDAIFREFLLSLGRRVEAEAGRVWGSAKEIVPPTLQYGETGIAAPSIDAKALKEALKSSAGPSGGANPNPHAAGSAEWLEHFGQNSANAISAAVSAVLKDLASKVVGQTRADNETSLTAINDMLGRATSDNLRTEILYWKEALFSSARSASYRRMSPDVAIYWAAWDLHNLVPKFHPQSAEYFLREATRTALGQAEATKELTSMQFCQAVAQTPESIRLQHEILKDQRLTLLEAVQASATRRMNVQAASAQTGLPQESFIPREELAVWLFRDLQVSRLAGGQ